VIDRPDAEHGFSIWQQHGRRVSLINLVRALRNDHLPSGVSREINPFGERKFCRRNFRDRIRWISRGQRGRHRQEQRNAGKRHNPESNFAHEVMQVEIEDATKSPFAGV
jgi:hypothetical protein